MSEPTYAGHPIVGTWRLISFTEQNLDTGAVSYPFGEEAKALSSNGYVATILTRFDRKRRLRLRRPIRRQSISTAACAATTSGSSRIGL